VKVSVKWRVQVNFATIRQNFPETRLQRIRALFTNQITIHDEKGIVMKQRFILFRRGDVFYCEDTTTHKQNSLRTEDPVEARALLHARNESIRQPILNLQLARTYLSATDPDAARRTWQAPMDELMKNKTDVTRTRYERAMMVPAFDSIRNVVILETHSAQFLKVLAAGGVATNVFLRRIQNFALDMNWLPRPVLVRSSGSTCASKTSEHRIRLGEHV
jgi:hypothetical protein